MLGSFRNCCDVYDAGQKRGSGGLSRPKYVSQTDKPIRQVHLTDDNWCNVHCALHVHSGHFEAGRIGFCVGMCDMRLGCGWKIHWGTPPAAQAVIPQSLFARLLYLHKRAFVQSKTYEHT